MKLLNLKDRHLVLPSLFALIATTALLLPGCGSGSGSSSAIQTPVTGYASKAPLTGATCNLYNSANQVVGSVATSSTGAIDFGTTTSSGALYAQCTGGTYLDEATGLSVTNTQTLSGSVILVAGTPAKLVITPLTQLAFLRAGGGTAGFDPAKMVVEAANVAKAFGLGDVDILKILPTDVNTSAADNTPAGRYGVVLAALAQNMKDEGKTLASVITTLQSAINTDGTLTPAASAALQTAVTNLTDPAKNSNTAVQAKVSAVTGAVNTALGTSTGASASASLTAVTPSTLMQGAAAANNYTLTGTGLSATTTIRLNGTACAKSGTANLAGTSLTGVDCSNVNAPASGDSVVMAIASPATAATSQSLTLTAPPAPMISVSGSNSFQAGGTLQLSATSTNTSTPITWSSDNANVTVDTAGNVTGTVVGTANITANQAALVGQFIAGSSAVFTVNVTADTVPALGFAAAARSQSLGEADFSNPASATCTAITTGYAPTVSYAIQTDGTINAGNTKAATVSSAGKVVVSGAGSVVVQASVPLVASGGNVCAAQTKSYTLTVNKATPVVNFKDSTLIANSAVSVDFGSAPVTNSALVQAPANLGSGTMPATTGLVLGYTSIKTSVATVNTVGTVSPVAVGQSTIVATVAGDANYNSITSSSSGSNNYYRFYVIKVTPTLTMRSTLTVDTTADASGIANAATLTGVPGATAPSGSITYSSDDPAIATVDASGKVTPVALGQVTIRAIYAGDTNYNLKRGTTLVTVADVTAESKRYIKISNTGFELASSATSWCAVKDTTTGLMWQNYQNEGEASKSFTNVGAGYNGSSAVNPTDAADYVTANNSASLCGFTGWRLPTGATDLNYGELYTLVVTGGIFDGYNPGINTRYFPYTAAYVYRTSSVVPGYTTLYYLVDFQSGYFTYGSNNNPYKVRLVRSTQIAP